MAHLPARVVLNGLVMSSKSLCVIQWVSLLCAATAVASEPSQSAPSDEVVVPKPWKNLRQMVGVAGWPAGLISDTRLQYRVPLHRSPSIVFQDTWAGFGGRARVTPAFVDVGPRVSIAPIDIFDVELQASYTFYWPSSSGLLPYDSITESTLDRDRGDRHRNDETRASAGWSVTASASPTLKAKVGPVIVLDGWKFEYFHFNKPDDATSRYVYEPFSDRLMAWDDMLLDHQAAALFELMDGKRRPQTLMVGALFKHDWMLVSKDSTMQLGGLILFKPSPRPQWPTFALQVLGYLKDPDRVGGPPSTSLAVIWDFKLHDSVHHAAR